MRPQPDIVVRPDHSHGPLLARSDLIAAARGRAPVDAAASADVFYGLLSEESEGSLVTDPRRVENRPTYVVRLSGVPWSRVSHGPVRSESADTPVTVYMILADDGSTPLFLLT
jgi:hypothetical protein